MTTSFIKAASAAIAALCLVGNPVVASASGGLSVSPITLEFDQNGDPSVLEVTNPGDKPIHVQVRLFDWTVDKQGDHYTPSRAIGFNPPMFELAPGAAQMVRLAPQTASAPREQAYRLFVDQLAEDAQAGQLQMPVRMVLPVFVAPAKGVADAAQGRLQWRLEFDAQSGQATLIAVNTGARRVKVTDLSYVKDGAAQTIRKGLAGYVLAGQERAWDFPLKGRLTSLDVVAATDAGAMRARVPFPAN